MASNHRVMAIHPRTGEIMQAVYKEDWFGPGVDAITFGPINAGNYLAENIQWDFPDEMKKGE